MGRSPCPRKEVLNRGAWTGTEDTILTEYIRVHGSGGWKDISKRAGLKRCAKSCRLRWLNYLRPDIKRGNISPEEEELIIRLHRLLGNRWSLIAGRLPGRTDNEIKNYWNTHMSKKPCLSMNESQPNTSQNLKTRSKSPVPVQNRVFKTTALKINPAARFSGTVRAGGYSGDGCSNRISNEAFNLCNVKETRKFSWRDLLMNDSIRDEESESTAFAMTNNPVEAEATNSLSFISHLADQESPNRDHFQGDAVTLSDSLLYLNEKSSPNCNLLPSPSDCSTDFASEEFYRGMEEFYDNVQDEDWIREFDY